MEAQNMPKLHTAEIRLNPETKTYGFYEGNKELKFAYLRPELDIRGGVEKRDTQYLIDEGVVKEDNKGLKVFEATVPFEVFSKNEAGEYELLQGNTRFKLLNQLIQHNQNILANLPEGVNDDPSLYILQPFHFLILPAEIDPNNPDQRGLILSRQHSTNNAVLQHSTDQVALFGYEYLQSLLAANSQKPKGERRKVGDIRNEVARAFNVPASRTYHWEAYVNFPEWLKVVIEEDVISLDTAIKLRDTSKRLCDSYVQAGKSDTLVNLRSFYVHCLDQARAEAGDRMPRIAPSVVDKVEAMLLEQVNPAKPESSSEGDDDFGGEDEDQTSESTSTEDDYKDVLEATAALETHIADMPSLDELPLYTEDGQAVYEMNELKQMIKAVLKLTDLVGKTAEIKNAQKEHKAAQRAAEKAAKKEQSLEGQETVDEAQELAPSLV